MNTRQEFKTLNSGMGNSCNFRIQNKLVLIKNIMALK